MRSKWLVDLNSSVLKGGIRNISRIYYEISGITYTFDVCTYGYIDNG